MFTLKEYNSSTLSSRLARLDGNVTVPPPCRSPVIDLTAPEPAPQPKRMPAAMAVQIRVAAMIDEAAQAAHSSASSASMAAAPAAAQATHSSTSSASTAAAPAAPDATPPQRSGVFLPQRLLSLWRTTAAVNALMRKHRNLPRHSGKVRRIRAEQAWQHAALRETYRELGIKQPPWFSKQLRGPRSTRAMARRNVKRTTRHPAVLKRPCSSSGSGDAHKWWLGHYPSEMRREALEQAQ